MARRPFRKEKRPSFEKFESLVDRQWAYATAEEEVDGLGEEGESSYTLIRTEDEYLVFHNNTIGLTFFNGVLNVYVDDCVA